MRRILRYLRAQQFECQLKVEMEAHLAEKIDELVADGLSLEEARAQATREFGNRTQVAEECREEWAFVSLDEIAQDLRYAFRVLRRNPVFTLVGVLSLAFGIGCNTVIFSAVDRVLLHALPYPDSDRLFAVWSGTQSDSSQKMHVSAADFYDWRLQSRAFESLAAYANWPMNLTNVEEPRRLQTELVSANLFSLLQTKAQMGRTFLADEDQEQ